MIIYVSNATNYKIFNRLFQDDMIYGSNQMQKFNNSIILGLSKYESVTVLSNLPYKNVSAERIDAKIDGIRYVAIRNIPGKFRKIYNFIALLKEGILIIKNSHPSCIVCDAIAKTPCYVATILSKIFNIPTVAIVTDFPGMLTKTKNINTDLARMQNYDAYVLLTKQMNPIVNPKGKPYIIMEGLCAPDIPPILKKNEKRIILYTGALWKHDAGIEYFLEGFLKANLDNCELHFYGVGELAKWIKSIENKNPKIKYLGCVTNDIIMSKQSEASLLINPRPSDEEFCKYSFPSKTIEYMASGTPVLMTRLPGVPDEYFDYVYLINKETPDGVCEALIKVFMESMETLNTRGIAAREFILSQKNYKVQTGKIYRLIGDVCKHQ